MAVLEQEVVVWGIQTAIRPNGETAVQVSLSFESHYVVKKPQPGGNAQAVELNINSPGIVARPHDEIKLVVFFNKEEWKKAEKRFKFGSSHRVKVDESGKIVVV